jgi:hypothetical protein
MFNKIYFLVVIRYWMEVQWSNLQRVFGKTKDASVIPQGYYCYVPDNERNEKEPTDGIWIKPCPYYRNMKNYSAACTYTGFIGFDFCLGDQCKICGKNVDYENEIEE